MPVDARIAIGTLPKPAVSAMSISGVFDDCETLRLFNTFTFTIVQHSISVNSATDTT